MNLFIGNKTLLSITISSKKWPLMSVKFLSLSIKTTLTDIICIYDIDM